MWGGGGWVAFSPMDRSICGHSNPSPTHRKYILYCVDNSVKEALFKNTNELQTKSP